MKLALTVLLTIMGFSVIAQTYDTNGEVVETFAGAGIPSYLDGQGQAAEFSNPLGIIADTSSNLYVWDSGNERIRKIIPNATVSTFAGGGTDLEGYGTNVSFSSYTVGAIGIDHSNTIWIVASYIGNTYFLNIQSDSYLTIQNGGAGFTNLSTSSGICFDSQNNFYYSGGYRVWKYDPSTTALQIFAGSGVNGHLDGNGIYTEFSSPATIVCDEANNIDVQDGSYIRRIDQYQNVTTITNSPIGNLMGVDNNGNVLIVNGNAIEKLTATTNILIYGGTTSFSSGTYTNGTGSLARFASPSSACFSQGSIFVSDTGNQRIRQISLNPQSQVVSGANLAIGTYAGVTVNGIVGRTYQIQSSPDMTNWTTASTILLNNSPYLWIDQNPVAGSAFYPHYS